MTPVKRIEGDITPFLEFAKYLLPIETDRKEVLRFFYTLVAHPEVRILYALLLVSEMQGVGKDTLATIARLLVGNTNTSNPGAQQVVESGFHDWIIDKALVVVSEIYEGESWKAYNKLKSFITQTVLQVNPKCIASEL